MSFLDSGPQLSAWLVPYSNMKLNKHTITATVIAALVICVAAYLLLIDDPVSSPQSEADDASESAPSEAATLEQLT